MSDIRNEGDQTKNAANAPTMEALCKAAYEGLLGASTIMPGVFGRAAVQAGVKVGEAVKDLGEDALIIGTLFSPAGAIGAKVGQAAVREAQKFMDAQAKKK